MMILQVILEGIGLGVLLILVCAIGIRKGAVGMVHLYSPEVQERCVKLGLTTHVKIKRNGAVKEPNVHSQPHYNFISSKPMKEKNA